MMRPTSILRSLPVGLLLSYAGLTAAAPSSSTLHQKRDPNFNVLHGRNFPDPAIIDLDGTSYVFGTNDGLGNDVPLTINSDFSNAGGWSTPQNAFPPTDVPAFSNWAEAGTVWAPDVNQLTDGDGSFAMYYCAALKSNTNVHCIGLARSLNVEGPYNDSSTEPWICPESAGGAIDPSGFLDTDGSRYVVYKIDGPAANGGGYCNSPSKTSYNTSLMLLQTSNNGYTQLTGSVVLYNNDGVDDSYNIEAPVIRKGSDGTYFLFFSSGCTSSNSYTTSYVTSTQGIWGPYGDRQVLIQTGTDGEFGPGGATPSKDNTQIVYHSLLDSNDINDGRVLNTDSLVLNGRTASIG